MAALSSQFGLSPRKKAGYPAFRFFFSLRLLMIFHAIG
ncbi:hypothetical protein CHCC20348_3862 [Bacillus paralicheniformis]|nr:hypothetical protein CHCC20348_3862 [Bacillus paralicheniformis]